MKVFVTLLLAALLFAGAPTGTMLPPMLFLILSEMFPRNSTLRDLEYTAWATGGLLGAWSLFWLADAKDGFVGQSISTLKWAAIGGLLSVVVGSLLTGYQKYRKDRGDRLSHHLPRPARKLW